MPNPLVGVIMDCIGKVLGCDIEPIPVDICGIVNADCAGDMEREPSMFELGDAAVSGALLMKLNLLVLGLPVLGLRLWTPDRLLCVCTETQIINKMGFKFNSWIQDVFCTQHLRVLGCKTHLELRFLAPF